MTTTDTTSLDRLEALAKAATPGPWQNGFDDLEGVVSLGTKDDGNVVCMPPSSYMELSQVRWDANAAFIAAANPATILEMLATIREQREALEPFASCADTYQDFTHDMAFVDSADGLTLADCRRARAALTQRGE